ncbi:MAG TPA: ADP-ribosylglycohydrolase family protein [Longimicrobium sp.]|nr:ADP-ribosylglycohydrolase family protein [Longimicrobium sp.]
MGLDSTQRLARATQSLQGLSVGDAFGERFFTSPQIVERLIEQRALTAGPWYYTDDTVMALSVVDVLSDCGEIDRDRLADFFGARYRLDPARGYGGTAHGILGRIAAGEPWHEVAPSVFDGGGSMGNGGAMRSAPIGAYFFDDMDRVVVEARKSAEVTHAHHEGQAGAIAVALAAAYVATGGTHAEELFTTVLAGTPDGATRAVLAQAAELPLESDIRTAVSALGNGTQVISQDTAPFSIWCATRHLGDFAEAMWTTVAGLGDRDTTCAIVGGIIAAAPTVKIPEEWLTARESLDRMGRSLLGAWFSPSRGGG